MAHSKRWYRKLGRIYVRCNTCDQQFDENKVEFLNIEEDIFGRDVLTFTCPTCKVAVRSFRTS